MRASGGQCASKLLRHQRAGIEADRTARENVASAQGDEVGRAGSGADEMHFHAFVLVAGHGAGHAIGGATGQDEAGIAGRRPSAPPPRRCWKSRSIPALFAKASAPRCKNSSCRARNSVSSRKTISKPIYVRRLAQSRFAKFARDGEDRRPLERRRVVQSGAQQLNDCGRARALFAADPYGDFVQHFLA